ncbi:superoxide dismutase [Patescibacteria group bacterium]
MYEKKDFTHLLGMEGFSDELLQDHFKLYEGYVANTNKLMEKLSAVETGTPEYAEMKRRFGWEWDGMRMHELYFGNLSKDTKSLSEDSDLHKKITEQFGSFEKWSEDFKATGAMRGIGWVILVQDLETKKLFNVWINEHDAGHLVGIKPLIVIDVFEHSYIRDYGLARADYISSFIKRVDWGEVENRFVA